MSDIVAKAAQYWKFIVATLTPVFLLIQAAVTDDVITTQEWVAIGASAIVAIGVALKGNKPAGKPIPLPPPVAPKGGF